jgi:hypothetical protein
MPDEPNTEPDPAAHEPAPPVAAEPRGDYVAEASATSDPAPIAQPAASHTQAEPSYEPHSYDPADDADEFDDQTDEFDLPGRPRRRLLAPLPVALLAVLTAACGFIAGVLVEKGQNSASSTAGSGATAGLAARFAALRAGASGASGAGGFPSRAGGFFGGSAGATVDGEVSFVEGRTLYVTSAEGATVKVHTSAGSTVTKTITAKVRGIHPGETVLVTGTTGANGAIEAESIRVGTTSGSGGLASLLGSSSSSSSRSSGASGAATSGSGGPALFGGG